MGTWHSLGIIQPIFGQWQLFDIASIGCETFRITFVFGAPPPPTQTWSSSLLIEPLYATDEAGPSVRVWPSTNKRIVFLPIPPDFKEAGAIVRYIAIKKLPRYRLGRSNEPQWMVRVEEYHS